LIDLKGIMTSVTHKVSGELVRMSRREISIGLLTGCQDRHYAFGLIKALISRGLCLEVIGSPDIDSPELHAIPQVNFLDLVGSETPHAGLVRKVLRVLSYYARLLPYAAVAKPEIFHILWNYRLEYFDRTLLMLYYKLLGKKAVLTAHNINAGTRDSNDSWLNRLTLRMQYRLADHIFVHTSKMRSDLVSQFGVHERAITLIPFGINNAVHNTGLTRAEARQRLQIGNEQKTILFFGRLGPYKGVELLVAAFQRILARDPNYRLIIAGKPRGGCEKYVAEIQEAIKGYGIQEQVRVRVEFIPEDDVEVYFMAADVSVLPYKYIFQSGVLFLAYSFGLPVIATDVGSFREEIIEGRTGFLCKPDDPADLANTIERYFASHLYRCLDQRRQEIRDYANERYSWDKVGELTLNAYQRLLGKQEPIRPRTANLQTEKRT
jgi:D-inositol-3-phosphate glycosyltransferase